MASVNIKTAANDFLSFVNASPTPYHAVRSVKEKLTAAGFKEVKVNRPFEIKAAYLILRNRNENHGRQRASQEESTISRAMDRQLLHLLSERSGGQETQCR